VVGQEEAQGETGLKKNKRQIPNAIIIQKGPCTKKHTSTVCGGDGQFQTRDVHETEVPKGVRSVKRGVGAGKAG